VPSALYVEAPTTIMGNVNINGNDSCGPMTDHKPGVGTVLDPVADVTINGGPSIEGADGSTPNVKNVTGNLNIQAMIDDFKKGGPDFSYSVTSQTHTGSSIPGPGDGWGSPTPGPSLQDPSGCSVSNIVHYDTNGTDVRLSTVEGCGILLIEGDLEISGSFNWYGVVATTGSIIFTGGGNRNVTGAVLSEGTVIGDVIGGNVNLVYCGEAITDQSENQPF
jgi:hypothetical protein